MLKLVVLVQVDHEMIQINLTACCNWINEVILCLTKLFEPQGGNWCQNIYSAEAITPFLMNRFSQSD